MASRLPSYLKAYRKKSGLSQEDIGLLLGHSNSVAVSRFERYERLPHLRTAAAFRLLFGVPIDDLFPACFDAAASEIDERLNVLEEAVGTGDTPAKRRKRQSIADIRARLKEYRLPHS